MRHAVLTAMLLTATSSLAADAAEPLDEDFLAYLAELESEDDDWTIVESPKSEATATKNSKPAAEPSAARPQESKPVTPAAPAPGSKP